MLTSDLAQNYETGNEVRPFLIDTREPKYRRTADRLIEIFENHLGETRKELEKEIDELTVSDTDYKVIQGLAKLLKDKSEFEMEAAMEPRKIRTRLFEKANEEYPIVRSPTLSTEDTQPIDVYDNVADELDISLKECYEGMYADLNENKRLVKFGDLVYEGSRAEQNEEEESGSSNSKLTDSSKQEYKNEEIDVDWLLNRYNLAQAQAVLYDAVEMKMRVWDNFSTVFGYVKLFGLMHRIYPIDSEGNRVSDTDMADGYEAVLDGPASLFSKSRKYGVRMASFLPALPLCDRWEMEASIITDEEFGITKSFRLSSSENERIESHYSSREEFDSDLERTLSGKWERSNTEWELVREDDVLDLGDEIMIPDFALERDGERAILEIVGFWTPEYLQDKLEKIRKADRENLILAVSENLDCSEEDLDGVSDRVLWFKTGIHVYDVVELAEEFAQENTS
jgi:predicted nuclease of restriction endonuclease-like RecB superfamily